MATKIRLRLRSLLVLCVSFVATTSVSSVAFAYDGHSTIAAKTGGEGLTTLCRAVKPDELADIQAQNAFRNLGQAEGKYFSTTAEGTASYSKQGFHGFQAPLDANT